LRLLPESSAEGAEGCGVVAADGCYDVVAGKAAGAGEVEVEGVSGGLGVRFVDLELAYKLVWGLCGLSRARWVEWGKDLR